jgi:hypothetical protein
MLHVICAALVVALALAEMTVIGQWTRQHALLGTQQVAAAAAFPIR